MVLESQHPPIQTSGPIEQNRPTILRIINVLGATYVKCPIFESTIFTRDEILNTVWGTEIIVGDRTIDVHIRKLREKLGDDYIKTVKGIGYKFDL